MVAILKGGIIVDKFQVFDFAFTNEELENEFHNFFYKYGLTPLFTNEHRSPPIKVSYVDARSVVKEGGKYNRELKDFADLLNLFNDNKSYEEALFKILYTSRSMQSMMNKIREISRFYTTLDYKHQKNLWNIVFYTKEKF